MSPPDRLRPGPHDKSGVWVGASLFTGYAAGLFLLAMLSIVSGGFLAASLWGWMVVLALFGFTLSIPYGLSWARGEVRQKDRRADRIDVRELPRGEPGSTYVIVEPEKRKGSKWVKSKELGPISNAIYAIGYRGPVVLGDAVLSATWTWIAQLMGRRSRGQVSDTTYTTDTEASRRRVDQEF